MASPSSTYDGATATLQENAPRDSSPKTESAHEAQRLFWVFVFGSFVGFVVETLYCMIDNGHFEWRGSMLFLPLSAVYGIGAVAFYAITPRNGQAGIFRVFFSGMLAGTLVEYLCSWLQQLMFGSVSWDYSQMPFNINGRVCLLFTTFWGLLALAWVKLIQPLVVGGLKKIPHRAMTPLTLVTLAILIISVIISAYAVTRWGARIDGLVATNVLELWADRLFPNELMESLYANMIFVN
jgi:uncharacterized membrane protein